MAQMEVTTQAEKFLPTNFIEWISDVRAARLLGVTKAEIIRMCEVGKIQARYYKNSHPGSTERKWVWSVHHESVLALVNQRTDGSDDNTDREWGTEGLIAEPEEPCVLYGLLTEDDVRELEKRRQRIS